MAAPVTKRFLDVAFWQMGWSPDEWGNCLDQENCRNAEEHDWLCDGQIFWQKPKKGNK